MIRLSVSNRTVAGAACASAIDVQSLISGAGDQGEADVTVSDNFFDNDGGGFENGVVHFGLGPDGPASNVSALDANDVVKDNVFTYATNYENNAVQLSDTMGALVTQNTVNYPTQDDNAVSALWFPGFNQRLTVSDNTLNGGGIDSDGTSPNLGDPKSGIKIIDDGLGWNLWQRLQRPERHRQYGLGIRLRHQLDRERRERRSVALCLRTNWIHSFGQLGFGRENLRNLHFCRRDRWTNQ